MPETKTATLSDLNIAIAHAEVELTNAELALRAAADTRDAADQRVSDAWQALKSAAAAQRAEVLGG